MPSSKRARRASATAAARRCRRRRCPSARAAPRRAARAPVGRDQRRRLPGVFQRLAQAPARSPAPPPRDPASSASRMPLKPPLGRLERLPFVRESGAAMALATARAARRRAAAPPDQRQRCTSPRATPIRSSSSFRWNCGWLASPRPFSSGPERIPLLVGKMFGEPKPGQHDHALGHPRNAGDERGDRRRGRGDAGRDGEAGRRLVPPALCASAWSSRLRRSARSIAPRSASICGHCS